MKLIKNIVRILWVAFILIIAIDLYRQNPDWDYIIYNLTDILTTLELFKLLFSLNIIGFFVFGALLTGGHVLATAYAWIKFGMIVINLLLDYSDYRDKKKREEREEKELIAYWDAQIQARNHEHITSDETVYVMKRRKPDLN